MDLLSLGILTLFFFPSIAFLAFVLASLLQQDWERWSRPSLRTMGRVVDYRKTENDGTFYHALVEFTDQQGKAHVIEDCWGSSMPLTPVGGTLEVEYCESSPHKGRVRRPLANAFVYITMLCLLALMMALGFVQISRLLDVQNGL